MKTVFVLLVVALVVISTAVASECETNSFFKDPIKCPVPTLKSKTHPSRGNQVCCPNSQCRTYLYTGKDPSDGHDRSGEMRYCFGASGDDCNGVPVLHDMARKSTKISTIIGADGLKRLAASVKPVLTKEGILRVPTSVGSIYHDSCCVAYPDGFFCNLHNQPFTSFLEASKNTCHCANEWRKAAFAHLSGRWWYTDFKNGGKNQVDFSPTGKSLPPTWLPLSTFGTTWLPKASNYGYAEVKATALLRAPSGTKLDCPVVDPGCNAHDSFLDKLSSTVEKKYPNGIVAGDSVYCQSGKFKSIHNVASPVPAFRRYGVCL